MRIGSYPLFVLHTVIVLEIFVNARNLFKNTLISFPNSKIANKIISQIARDILPRSL